LRAVPSISDVQIAVAICISLFSLGAKKREGGSSKNLIIKSVRVPVAVAVKNHAALAASFQNACISECDVYSNVGFSADIAHRSRSIGCDCRVATAT